jgi:hypothetical protein
MIQVILEIILGFAKIVAKLLNYIQHLRLKKYIEKNLVYIDDYGKDLLSPNVLNDILEKDNVKLRVKPQEMFKLFNNLIEYQNQLYNLEKENPDQSYLSEIKFHIDAYNCFKMFYVSLFYLLNKKYEDTYTIISYLEEKVKEVQEYYDVHGLDKVNSVSQLKIELDNLNKLSEFILTKCYVKMSKGKVNQNKMIVDSEVKKPKVKFNGYLEDQLIGNHDILTPETFNLFKDKLKISYDEYIEAIEKCNYNNYSHLVQLPPNVDLLTPKPINYDLTFQRFNYPNLQERMKKQDKGILGRALGYFWNK